MLKITEAIIVEGKYDKQKVAQYIDATVIAIHGFAIYSDKPKQALLRRLAAERGIIVLTDSDSAGLRLRRFIRNVCGRDANVKEVFLPEIAGREKRKTRDSAEGLLGVEGIDGDIITAAIQNAVTAAPFEQSDPITTYDFYSMGLSGGDESKIKRQRLCKSLSLPAKMSSKELLSVINALYSKEELSRIIKDI